MSDGVPHSCRTLEDVMSSSVHRCRVVSWCVDSAPSQTHTETSGNLNNAASSHHLLRTNREAPSQIPLIQLNPEADGPALEGLDEGFHLPRSSPVISRRHKPVSWMGGVDDSATPSSPVSGSSSPSSDSLAPCERRIDNTMEDLSSSPVQENKQQRHPFRESQEVLGEQKGWSHSGSSHPPGFSFSTRCSHDRRSSAFPEFPADIFKSSCELEKENAHFVVVDMVLEVLEGVKWTKSFNRWFSNMNRNGNIEERCEKTPWSCEDTLRWKAGGAQKYTTTVRGGGFRSRERKTPSSEGSGEHQHIQDEEEEEEEEWEPGNNEDQHQPKTFSVLSSDSGFEDYSESTLLTHTHPPISAEWLAQQLVVEFRRSWFPSKELRQQRLSLRSSLQELPGTGGVVCSGSLTEEIRLRTRMRGTLSWTPPCFQIISSVQPTYRRSVVLAFQHFLCAGCGTEVEPRYMKKLRYCEYLGRLVLFNSN